MYLQIDIYLPFIPFLFNFYSCKQLYLFILTIFIFFINLSFFNSFFELIYNIIKYKISKQIYLSTTVIIYFEFHLRLMRLKITTIISKTQNYRFSTQLFLEVNRRSYISFYLFIKIKIKMRNTIFKFNCLMFFIIVFQD